MKVCLLTAALPPVLDGIGDYTGALAAELAGRAEVHALVPTGRSYHPIDGVHLHPAFSTDRRGDIWQAERVVREIRPDWLVLQYNPFSWGNRGLNLSLPRLMRALRNRLGVRIAIMVHETFMPIHNWRCAVMTTYQRYMFIQLGRGADVLFFSIAPWAERFSRWFRGKPVHHLPAGSSIPRVCINREAARQRLSIESDQIVLGIFGTAHPSRLFGYVRAAAEKIQESGQRPLILYMGPHADQIRAALGGVPTLAQGPFEPEEISRRFAAVDISVAPYSDGVSTRRTAMITGLQHAIPTVATLGENTDAILKEQDGTGILLARNNADAFSDQVLMLVRDRALRERIGAGGKALFDSFFSWPVIASKMLGYLAEGGTT